MTALWMPTQTRIARSQILDLMALLNQQTGRALGDYASLHRFSVHEPERFWSALWSHAHLIGTFGDPLISARALPDARFFPNGTCNLAENCLRPGKSDALALVMYGEGGARQSMSRGELRQAVARVQCALIADGVVSGDIVAGFLPNGAEAVIAALATLSLGAIWTSCSPDFGIPAIIDRFGQTRPKILFATTSATYGGTTRNLTSQLHEILKTIGSIQVCFLTGQHRSEMDVDGCKRQDFWSLPDPKPESELLFEAVGFQHPAFVVYSSGTTGAPKCIVHSHGGTLLQVVKEHRYHVDLHPGDRLFYYTTCGWMMWNWLLIGLASQAALMLYDGSPFAEGPETLWRLAAEDQWTVFGTSAKYLSALHKSGYTPNTAVDLSALETVLSTGSPLAPATFEFVYRAVKSDLLLGSISGGTDIVSCFCLCCPILPVYAGQLQCAGLGMAVDVLDSAGNSVEQTQGELVCRRPFPSLPVGFLNDPDGVRFKATYFEHFPGVWTHGDFAQRTAEGGWIIHGRSDTTLNPGGVRIGTSELYRVLENIPVVQDAVAIGWRPSNQDELDELIVLFVVLAPDTPLDEDLQTAIRVAIREAASPRHVPKIIAQVADVPRTISGKIAELAVRQSVHGDPIRNLEALENPDALALFQNHPALGL